jgi:hypothetical protein
MSDAVDVRKRFVQALDAHPLVEDLDFSRDGYETVSLTLGDVAFETDDETGLAECPVCGAVGLEERIKAHDCAGFREWKEVDS